MDAELRTLVWRRAGECCEYCRLPQSVDALPFQIDHIIAEKPHGPTVLENLALSCFNCNAHKGPNIAGIDPVSAGRWVCVFENDAGRLQANGLPRFFPPDARRTVRFPDETLHLTLAATPCPIRS